MVMRCLETDLGAVFASSDFGEAENTVTWRGDPVSWCIFDNEDVTVEMGEGVGEIVHQTTILAPSRDFIGIADGDVVTARGDTYRVKHWMDDGAGLLTIFLEVQ